MVKFFDTEKKLALDEIKSIEARYNLSFPVSYLKHLLAYNGGRCEPNIFEFVENEIVTESDIDWFLAIYNGEFDNLEDYIKTYKIENIRLPLDLIPIAHDSGGNLICISSKNEGIYFWDHEKEMSHYKKELEFNNVYLISKSLQIFFNSLK